MTTPPAPLRQFERQRRLAAGGRPCDKHGLARTRAEFACMSLVATLICNPGQSRARQHHRRRRTGRSALARPGALAVRRGRRRHSLRRRSRARRHHGDRNPAARGARRPADRHCRAACRRRRKKLFLADMDSTMIGQECIDELADFAGLKAHVAAITERAMRGEIEFEPALRERVALLKDLPVSVVDEVLAKRITLTPGGRELVTTMRAQRRLHLPGLGRFHAVHQRGRRHDRLPGKPRQRADDRGRQTDRPGHRADPRPRRQARDADRAHAKASTSTTSTRWWSATAPTISA